MTKETETLKLALEALEQLQGGCTDHKDGTVEAITVWCPEVIDAIKEALAQPPLPVQPQRQPLTDEQKDAARYRWLRNPDTDVSLVLDKRTNWVPPDDVVIGVGGYWQYEYRAGEELDAAVDQAIEAKLKEKNYG